jgi:hypothetical protein
VPDYRTEQKQRGDLRCEGDDVERQGIHAEEFAEGEPICVLAERPHISVGFGGQEGGRKVGHRVNIQAQAEPAEVILEKPAGQSRPVENDQ